MRYAYTAINLQRKKSKGIIVAEDKSAALSQLLENNLTALELRAESEAGQDVPFWQKELGGKDIHALRLPKKRLLAVLNQMAIMMHAGVSLTMAMDVLVESQKEKKLKAILEEIRRDLFDGIPISESMAKFRAFPQLIVSMVESGEENGRLDTAFARCATLIEKEMALSSKIRGALGYPAFLLVLTLFVLIIMNTIVLPSFTGLFQQFGAELPLITKIVMAFSGFMVHSWYILLALFLLLALVFHTAMRKVSSFAVQVDAAKLKIPVIGELMRQAYIARFCNVMASLVEAGVDIVRALQISREIITNRFMQRELEQVISDVKVGVTIYAAMLRFSVFDSLFVSMVRVGEESGMLSESMKKMAELYEQQTETSSKQLTSLMEPALTVLIALVVGVVIVSIVVPMFGMYDLISRG